MNTATVEKLEVLVHKATNAGNASLLNRYLDDAIDDNRCAVIRSGSSWALTTNGFLLYEGDFTTIRSKTVAIIEDHLNTMQSLLPVPVKTEITDRDVEWSLEEAGYYDIYVLRNDETGEIDIESMQRGCYTNWGEDWTVLVCVRAHEVSRAARAGKGAKAVMRRLLEGRGH